MANSSIPGENRGGKSKYLNGSASLLVADLPPIEAEDGCWSKGRARADGRGLLRRARAGNRAGPGAPGGGAATVAVSEGSLVVACYRGMAWRRAAAGAPAGGVSSMALV